MIRISSLTFFLFFPEFYRADATIVPKFSREILPCTCLIILCVLFTTASVSGAYSCDLPIVRRELHLEFIVAPTPECEVDESCHFVFP
jgi:hypothetical protein